MWYCGFAVIARQDLLPPGPAGAALSKQHRRVEVRFHPTASRPPDVEIAVTARLEEKEHNNQAPHQEDRQRRGLCARKRDGHRKAEPGHGPVRRVIKARAPHGAAIDFAAVEVCNRADLRRVELASGCGRHLERIHALPLFQPMLQDRLIAPMHHDFYQARLVVCLLSPEYQGLGVRRKQIVGKSSVRGFG